MLNRLKSLFSLAGSDKSAPPVDVSSIAPARPLLAVGDIHGSNGLLWQALRRVDEVIAPNGQEASHAGPQLVFVGDYVDRGENSAEVLRSVFDLHREMPGDVVCLMGNHERMMLEFLDDPAGKGQRWLRNGGLQTLASFRIGGVREQSDVEELSTASAALEEALPDGMLDWLRQLPLIHQSGNVCVVHAAMDPHLGPREQSRQAMLWGHPEFLSTPREDDLWVVHGHTIMPEPQIVPSRISIDTGAYHTGQLTVALIETGSCRFV